MEILLIISNNIRRFLGSSSGSTQNNDGPPVSSSITPSEFHVVWPNPTPSQPPPVYVPSVSTETPFSHYLPLHQPQLFPLTNGTSPSDTGSLPPHYPRTWPGERRLSWTRQGYLDSGSDIQDPLPDYYSPYTRPPPIYSTVLEGSSQEFPRSNTGGGAVRSPTVSAAWTRSNQLGFERLRNYSNGRPTSRGSLFGRLLPAKRNLWLPSIIVGTVIGVFALVKLGGKGKGAKG